MNSLPKYILSKSTFLKGLQCEKAFFLYKHHYNLKDKISAQQQAIFNQGNAVGELAQDLFTGGVDASPSSYFKMQESVFKTKEFISVFNLWDDTYPGEDYDEIKKYIEIHFDDNDFDVTEIITIIRCVDPDEI